MEKKIQFIVPTIIACLLWGSAFPMAKIAFEYVPPITLSGMRFVIAGALLLPFIFLKKISIRVNIKQWRFMLLFAFLQTFLQYGLFFVGLNMVPAPTAAIIIGGAPLFIAIMSHMAFKTDKITLRKSIAICLGLSGVVFISLAKGSVLSSDMPYFYIGVLLLVVSNILGGYTNIMVAKYGMNINPIVLTSFANLAGGVLLLITGYFVERPEIDFSASRLYPSLFGLSIISAVSFSIWYTLLQKPGVKVSELNMWKFIIPVTGCIMSWLVLKDESPDWMSITGIITITLSLQILQFPESITIKLKQLLSFRTDKKSDSR